MKGGRARIVTYINFQYPHQQSYQRNWVLARTTASVDHPNGYSGVWNWKISTQYYGQFTVLQLIVVDRAEIVYNTEGYYCSQTVLLFS